jgi:hypothetical protein
MDAAVLALEIIRKNKPHFVSRWILFVSEYSTYSTPAPEFRSLESASCNGSVKNYIFNLRGGHGTCGRLPSTQPV